MWLVYRNLRCIFAGGVIITFFCCVSLVFQLNLVKHEQSGAISWHHLAVIVPFRDRFEELLDFVPHMSHFLKLQNLTFSIIVINQADNFRFNRGALINIGYIITRNSCDYLVMHDVDLLPLNSKLSYGYPEREDVMVHLAAPHLHPKYHYPTFVGGILLMRHQLFARLNGLSNKYWGWGLEDDEFYLRAKEAHVYLQRPPADIGTGINDTFRHVHDARRRPRDVIRIGGQRRESRRRDRITGINSINYKLSGSYHLQIAGYPVEVYNVYLRCNLSLTPWCKKPRLLNSEILKQA